MSRRFHEIVILPIIFALILLVYLKSGVVTSFDSRWALPTALSILHASDTSIDEYSINLDAGDDNRVNRVERHLYSKYPIGVPLVVLPMVAVIDQYSRVVWHLDLYYFLQHNPPSRLVLRIEKFLASVIVCT